MPVTGLTLDVPVCMGVADIVEAETVKVEERTMLERCMLVWNR